MTGRRILVCSTYYWPEPTGNAPYVTQLCEHLAARGDQVTVATGFPHYPEWRPASPRRPWANETHNGVRLRRRWHVIPSRPTALRRGLYEASLAFTGLSALPLRPRADVVLGIVPTLAGGVLAAMAAKAHRAPLGLVFQDLLGQAVLQNGVRGSGRVARATRSIELATARRAAAVGVVADGFRPYLVDGGVQPARLWTLPNWTHVDEPTEAPDETRRRLGWGPSEFVFLHSGNMGQKQGLGNLIETARVLRARGCEGVRVVLAGDGNDRSRLEAAAAGLENVSFLPVQPPGLYESMLRAADVLLVNQRATVADAAKASKLTSYFAAGKPVLAAAAAESETALEVARAEAGVVVEPDNPERLAEAAIALAADPAARETYGRSAARYAREELSAAKALRAYDAFIDSLLEGAA